MSHAAEVVTDPDTVPPAVRTAAYYVQLGASAAVLLATGLAPIWLADPAATQVVATGGVITAVVGLVAGGLGVAYRPTR
jgi:hypothetical protein